MERFNSRIAIAILVAVAVIFVVELQRGKPLYDIFSSTITLAVAAIPEGLPVALTVALAIGMNRMAKRIALAFARNATLLLMVLFENFMVFSSRSELAPAF